MHVWLKVEYILPEENNTTIVVGCTVTAWDGQGNKIHYYDGSLPVGSTDQSSKLTTDIINYFTNKYETETGTTIGANDRKHVFGCGFIA